MPVKPWSDAWQEAATGASGFYPTQLPYRHFTTSVIDGSAAAAIEPYVRAALAHCPRLTVVDAGAGTGLLLAQLSAGLTTAERDRVHWIAMDLRPRPATLPAHIEWRCTDASAGALELSPAAGIVIAHELLDDVPCPVLERDEHGAVRVLACDPADLAPIAGRVLGLAGDQPLEAWLAQWWPMDRPLMRAEIGLPRERMWTALTGWIERGYAIVVDYGHVREDRVRGVWDGGTLVGYREGRVVPPRADGLVNLTAHVAMDALAASASGAPATSLVRCGPTPDFWRLVQAYGGLPLEPDRMPG